MQSRKLSTTGRIALFFLKLNRIALHLQTPVENTGRVQDTNPDGDGAGGAPVRVRYEGRPRGQESLKLAGRKAHRAGVPDADRANSPPGSISDSPWCPRARRRPSGGAGRSTTPGTVTARPFLQDVAAVEAHERPGPTIFSFGTEGGGSYGPAWFSCGRPRNKEVWTFTSQAWKREIKTKGPGPK